MKEKKLIIEIPKELEGVLGRMSKKEDEVYLVVRITPEAAEFLEAVSDNPVDKIRQVVMTLHNASPTVSKSKIVNEILRLLKFKKLC